ncbi:MAG TPA: holo-ACP synthase [Candidatus Kapabacteria bacterium]|nr:holo-ACP synthase [Candidatus Kapabacteria bacterium]
MIVGIGTDIIETERIKKAIEEYGLRFLDRLYTKDEQNYCESFNDTKWVHYAVRFAAKESFSKAIGTGITKEFKFKEIAILNEESGKPYIVLSGGLLDKYGKLKSHISLSHTDNNSQAFVILENS